MPSRVSSLIRRIAVRQSDPACTIQRSTGSLDEAGAPLESWADHLLEITCAVFIKSGTEIPLYGGERNRRFGTVYVDAGLDITAGDRLVWDGRTFDIQAVLTPGARRPDDPLAFTRLEVEETS